MAIGSMWGSAALPVLLLIAFAVLAGSCTQPLPRIPTPQVAGVDPEVRDAILTAHQQAVADPTSGQASGRLGMVLQAHALYPDAVECYQRALRLDPKEFTWHYDLAVVYQQISEVEKALAELTAALRIRSDYAPAVMRKADLLFQLGRFRESEEAYKSLLAEDPGSALSLYGVARAKFGERDMAGAEDFYGRACRAYQTFGAAYYGLAMAQKKLGKDASAARNLELAQNFGADHPPLSDTLTDQVSALATGVHSQLERGDALARRGRMDEAAQLNEAVYQRDPQSFTALLNLLYLSRFLDRFDSKLEDLFANAKRINPQVPLIYDYYAAALTRQGKYDAASAALRKAIELRPDYGEAHAILGEILERQNHLNEAVEQYQKALAAQSSDPSLQIKLWRLLIIQGRSREVIPQLTPALQTEDKYSAMRLILMGEAYRTTGETAKARQYLEEARSRASQEGPPGLVTQIEQELAQIAARP